MAPSKISDEWLDFMATRPNLIDHSKDIEDIRASINKQSLENISLLKTLEFSLFSQNVTVEDCVITLPEVPGHEFPVRIYSPSRSKLKGLPVMLYFHSGYWCTGNVDSDDLGCRAMIAHGNDLVIFSFGYRLAPENSWNTIFSDAEKSMTWMVQNANAYGGDTSKGFFIGGATGGAYLAAICVIRAKVVLPSVKILGQCLIVPSVLSWTDVESLPEEWTRLVTSHADHAEAPLLSEMDFQRYLSLLNIPPSEARNGENFPVWADHEGLPPAYFAMDGPDPTRDEGYIYEKLLREAGVKTRIDHYEMPNWFVQFPQMTITRRAGMELAAGVRWLLDSQKYGM